MKNLFLKLNKIAEYLLYLLVLILPFQTRWMISLGELNDGYFEYGTISLYASDVLLVFLIGLIFFLKHSRGAKKHVTKVNAMWLLVGGIEMMVFISLLLSNDFTLSLFIYARFLLALSLFWLIYNFKYHKSRLIIVLMLSMMIQSVIGIYQFNTGYSPSSTTFGMAEHVAADLGASVVEVDGERFLRAYGSFDHPNIFGGFLAVGLLIFVIFVIKKNVSTTQSLSLMIICMVALFFTFSRAAWLAFAVGLFVILILAIIRRELKVQKTILYIILTTGVVFYVLFIPYKDLVVSRFTGVERLEAKSIEERINYFGEAKQVVKDNWLLGVGIGNYSNYVHKEMDSRREVWKYQPVHNTFMLIWAEIGLVGLMFFVGILQVIFSHIIKHRKNKDSFRVYKLGILAAILILMMLDHWLWSLHFGVFWFWFVVGLL